MKNLLITLSLFLILPNFNYAQSKQIKSKKTVYPAAKAQKQYQFSEAWVWNYQNFEGEKGEMVIYRDPKSGCWLLTQEAFGNTDGMCDWILAKPNGEYFFAYKNAEFGSKNSLLKQKIQFPTNLSLPDYLKLTGQKKDFGIESYGYPKFNGTAYNVKYEKTNDKSILFIGNTTANLAPLYHFNSLIADAKLPVFFPTDLPTGKVALADNTITSGRTVFYTFQYISHTDYHIDFADYE